MAFSLDLIKFYNIPHTNHIQITSFTVSTGLLFIFSFFSFFIYIFFYTSFLPSFRLSQYKETQVKQSRFKMFTVHNLVTILHSPLSFHRCFQLSLQHQIIRIILATCIHQHLAMQQILVLYHISFQILHWYCPDKYNWNVHAGNNYNLQKYVNPRESRRARHYREKPMSESNWQLSPVSAF